MFSITTAARAARSRRGTSLVSLLLLVLRDLLEERGRVAGQVEGVRHAHAVGAGEGGERCEVALRVVGLHLVEREVAVRRVAVGEAEAPGADEAGRAADVLQVDLVVPG